ncbi:MAG: 3-deoxy-7-phosphoheptulonate synthase, partial [bacterium]|nr:3-deoxy-7-phosphoheptulonate synthase [bacterium]
MIILMQPKASAKHVADIIAQVEADGYHPHLTEGDDAKIIGVVGESATPFNTAKYEAMNGVASVRRVSVPYKLASREMHPKDT